MSEKIIHVVPYGGKELKAVGSKEHEFLMSSHDVAKGYGISTSSLRSNKNNHKDELIEGKHFISSVQILDAGNLQQKRTLWTKKGIVRLGFFIKSQEAKMFRDWAEDYIINGNTYVQPSEFSTILPVMMEMISGMNKMMEMMGTIINNQTNVVNQHLTPTQLDQIKLAVNRAAKPLADCHGISWGRAIKEVYTELNGRMGVFAYYHISPNDFDDAMKLLEKMKQVKEHQLNTGEVLRLSIEITLD